MDNDGRDGGGFIRPSVFFNDIVFNTCMTAYILFYYTKPATMATLTSPKNPLPSILHPQFSIIHFLVFFEKSNFPST